MLKAVIIDDEADAIASLKVLLEEFCEQVTVEGTAATLMDGIKLINIVQPDVVFLDIQLNTGSGFDLLGFFPDRKFHVVFVTAYEAYALKAIKHQALDYLLEPIDIDELQETLSKVKPVSEAAAEKPEGGKNKGQKIAVHTNDGIIFIPVKDIVHIKAEGSYSVIYPKDQKPVMVSKNLKEIERMLDGSRFFRVHNSHLINLKCVEKYIKAEGGRIIMTDKFEIEVSRNKKDQFLAIMQNNA